jgi:hypothetical protein
MLPERKQARKSRVILQRYILSAEIQFTRISDIDVDIFADAAGLAALGPRLPDAVD